MRNGTTFPDRVGPLAFGAISSLTLLEGCQNPISSFRRHLGDGDRDRLRRALSLELRKSLAQLGEEPVGDFTIARISAATLCPLPRASCDLDLEASESATKVVPSGRWAETERWWTRKLAGTGVHLRQDPSSICGAFQ